MSSAPTGRRFCTACLASSPDSTTLAAMPLRSSALTTTWIRSLEASRENSASASSLGPSSDGSSDRPVPGWTPTSFTADFGEALMDQCNRHRPLAYSSSAAFDRPAADVAGSEQPGQVRLERQRLTREHPSLERFSRRPEFGTRAHVPGIVHSNSYLGSAASTRFTPDADEQRLGRQARDCAL